MTNEASAADDGDPLAQETLERFTLHMELLKICMRTRSQNDLSEVITSALPTIVEFGRGKALDRHAHRGVGRSLAEENSGNRAGAGT